MDSVISGWTNTLRSNHGESKTNGLLKKSMLALLEICRQPNTVLKSQSLAEKRYQAHGYSCFFINQLQHKVVKPPQ